MAGIALVQTSFHSHFSEWELIKSDFDAARNDLDEAFFDSILAGWWRKITKDKSFLASQNGQLLILNPLKTNS